MNNNQRDFINAFLKSCFDSPLKEQFKSASEELLQYQDTIIGKDIYVKWLQKHKSLFKEAELFSRGEFLISLTQCKSQLGEVCLSLNRSEVNEFYWMYNYIREVYEEYYLPYQEIAKSAIEDYYQIDTTNEFELLKWLTTYEETVGKLVCFIYPDIASIDCTFIEVMGVKIKTSDFEDLIKSYFLFENHFQDMLVKYTTFKKGDVYIFEQEFIQSVREKHILDSKQKYQHYIQEYKKYPREEPMLNSEEEFVKYLKETYNEDFLDDYIREYCEEEYEQHSKEYDEMLHNSSSLTYHLKQRGIIIPNNKNEQQ